MEENKRYISRSKQIDVLRKIAVTLSKTHKIGQTYIFDKDLRETLEHLTADLEMMIESSGIADIETEEEADERNEDAAWEEDFIREVSSPELTGRI